MMFTTLLYNKSTYKLLPLEDLFHSMELEEAPLMHCYQCEQTIRPTNGCVKVGVCTKNPQMAALQDLVIYGLGCQNGINPHHGIQYLFSTLTNTNHNVAAMHKQLDEIAQHCEDPTFKKFYKQFVKEGNTTSELSPRVYYEHKYGKEVNSLVQIGIQGLKGAAAYADNARVLLESLGREDDKELLTCCNELLKELKYFVCEATEATVFDMVLNVGRTNLNVTKLLDQANADLIGVPELNQTPTKLVPGPCILITGHDMAHLKSLLAACEREGVNVYTHSEMSPAFMYPELKKSPRLIGNFGNAWWKQQTEFLHFPGPVLFTTNCIMKPIAKYAQNCYATGAVGYEGVKYVKDHCWDELIADAKRQGGFKDEKQCEDAAKAVNQGIIDGLVGFNHRTYMELKPKLIELIKTGKLKGMRYIGGCDGMNPHRKVFLNAAKELPNDWLVLTGACGRFRINKEKYGTLEGIPRLLDMGQCNDVYSATVIMRDLAKELGVDVNDLPIELYVSWYEQKATVQLLSLLSLGVKGIKLGPTANAGMTENVLKTLNQKFGVEIISA